MRRYFICGKQPSADRASIYRSRKTGFITACYIVIVAIVYFFIRKKAQKRVWAAVVLSVGGLYLLCINESFEINKGDVLVFICSIMFSLHIIAIDYFSPKVDGVKMSCIQFFICGMLSLIPMFAFESPTIQSICDAWIPLLYTGVMSSGVAYTMQIIAQRGMDPTIASLIVSLESCFSVLAGWLLLNQRLTARELAGCGIMFLAIIIAQLPYKQRKNAASEDREILLTK